MAVLEFIQKGSRWVAEFKATADFNLHIEREDGGFLYVQQRTSESGEYDSVHGVDFASQDKVIDYDFTALVYPKFIKIVSEVEPTYAAVVSDGEVTEIKSQSKEIEVTSNGTTVVEPDAGFAYLNKVSVKTNVPQSGGSGGDSWRYYDCSNAQDKPFTLGLLFHLVKGLNDSDQSVILPTYFLTGVAGVGMKTIIACAVDLSAPIKDAASDSIITMEEFYAQVGTDLFPQLGITEISKEEFYAL